MSFIRKQLIRTVARRFNVGDDVLAYLEAVGKIGQPSEVAIPGELVPLGARLYGRGMVNQQFFAANLDWVLPYWVVRQYDPADPGFLGRGLHLYHLNQNRRDWTAIGMPGHPREAIVDPRGLVTPWYDGWSLDAWVRMGGQLYAPSRIPQVEQSLSDELPLVVTRWQAGPLEVTHQAFVAQAEDGGVWVLVGVTVANPGPELVEATLYYSVRPYNPEGVSLVRRLEWRQGFWWVNGTPGVLLPPPDGTACADLRAGDVSLRLPNLDGSTAIECPAGLATAVCGYNLTLTPEVAPTAVAAMPIEPLPYRQLGRTESLNSITAFNEHRARSVELWHDRYSQGLQVALPDERMQRAFQANKAFLLLMWDGDEITPGPFTYHHFWFRDAAYLVTALDRMGYHDEARRVLSSYPRRQRKDGFFISQEGEWDANGQALWTLAEHYRLTGDSELLEVVYPAVKAGVDWIEAKRATTRREAGPLRPEPLGLSPALSGTKGLGTKPFGVIPSGRSPLGAKPQGNPQGEACRGLLPPGFSAEHLGPNDYFYWDDLWCVAGERAAAEIARVLGQTEDAHRFQAAAHSFWGDVEASWRAVEERLGAPIIPASPFRRADSAMVGSLAALYPLRLFDPHDERITATLAVLKEVAFVEGTFFHQVEHAAFGTYLALHVAQCHLLRREPELAWPIIRWVLDHASPTWCWAEGINPCTWAGGMGDGHHGWALADWLHVVRNLLLFEEDDHLVLGMGMPAGWAAPGQTVSVRDAPTYFGRCSYALAFGTGQATLRLEGDWRRPPEHVELNLPFSVTAVERVMAEVEGHRVRLPPHTVEAVISTAPP